MVSDAVLATRSTIAAHDLTLDVHVPDDAQMVFGDPSRLQQVLVNLLVNAAKYTPAGGSVRLSLTRENNKAMIEVADTGVGMSRQLQQSAFEPFVQADETLNRSEGGMGLGLTLVKSLIELHEGQVSVASEGEGCGCVFSINLPITRRPPAPETTQNPTATKQRPSSELRLLIVEDNQDACDMLKMLLDAEGYVVRTAGDGIAALAAIEAEPPDIALVDLGLPELDGYEVAKRVRRKLSSDEMRLIALTGYGQPSDRKKTRAAGFDDHLTKPVDLEALLAAVSRSTDQAI